MIQVDTSRTGPLSVLVGWMINMIDTIVINTHTQSGR
jgi:hypothetical protein